MEVEEDYDSSQNNFCFPDNSTNPETTEALHAETIREDPAPSTSRMVVPMASRNFRINKTVLRRMALHTGGRVTRRRLPPFSRRHAAPPPPPATAAGAQGCQNDHCAGASGSSAESALGEYLSWLEPRQPEQEPAGAAAAPASSATVARHLELSAADERRAERALSGRNRKRASDACAALRIALGRIRTMSDTDPEALRDSLSDQAIDMLKKFHIS